MKDDKKKTVFVAMSGGVDSSVAAALLKKRGFTVIGAHMKCYNVDGCAAGDAEDARRVAEQLGIPFYVFDFEDEYKKRVVDYMIDGYKKGITPNPDVMCNKEIKFGLFLEKAVSLGADYIATGHYVRLRNSYIRKPFVLRSLYSAKDKNKDQSYFLWTLTQNQLEYCLFPIGEYTKPRVRALAKKFGLLTAAKKDSQGVCFLGQISLEQFLKQYIKKKPGNILNLEGKIVGRHRGVQHYTIGQRRLGIPNMALGEKGTHETTPHYIVAKDIKKNTITIAPAGDKSLYQKEIILTNLNFINPFHFPLSAFHILVRVRYRQPLVAATLTSNIKLRISNLVFDKPQAYIASGQSAVFYNARERNLPARLAEAPAKRAGRQMLGGGIIVER
mgnify:CR=1 FL=1